MIIDTRFEITTAGKKRGIFSQSFSMSTIDTRERWFHWDSYFTEQLYNSQVYETSERGKKKSGIRVGSKVMYFLIPNERRKFQLISEGRRGFAKRRVIADLKREPHRHVARCRFSSRQVLVFFLIFCPRRQWKYFRSFSKRSARERWYWGCTLRYHCARCPNTPRRLRNRIR